ncbi:interleukin-12 receptor subunit beta-2 [Osmerus eperlanus]|uniref:interleukin-12 receptor subunit beta-2 n=1 Tax=Osmerus eperlanus TaxID=29151 RepID=UPI002E13BE56
MCRLTWARLLPVLLMLGVHFGVCLGRKPCVAFSSAPTTLPRGSSFQVFCTFPPGCSPMRMQDQAPAQHNATTLVLNVTRIQRDSIYSCRCGNMLEPCGLDVYTGYPPAVPEELSCFQDGPGGEVWCSWKRGRETHLLTNWMLWVRRGSGVPVVSYRGNGSGSAWVPEPGPDSSVFSVWVNASNKLGSNLSTTLNFTLRDIVRPRPPVLSAADCSSRSCVLRLEGSRAEMQAQYRTAGQRWTPCPLSGRVPQGKGCTRPQPCTSLQPYRLDDLQPYQRYDFRVRIRFRTVFWSEWSDPISNTTDDDVPVKAVDAWYTLDDQSLHIHWKRLSDQEASGRVLFYEVIVRDQKFSTNPSTNHLSVQRNCFLSACEVTVVAGNSRGRSPPASLSIRTAAAPPPQDVSWRVVSNSSVALFWRRPGGAGEVQGYLVEWYPAGRRTTDLNWVRLTPEHNHTTLTDIRPYGCYSGAVLVEYAGSPGKAGSLGRAGFEAVHTWEKVPTAGPSFRERVESAKVTLSFLGMPDGHSQGCVLHYNACVSPSREKQKIVCSVIPAWKQQHSLDLPPGHTLWLTASTAAGEGPRSKPIINRQHENQNPSPGTIVLLVCLITAVVMVMMCLWHCSAVQQRVYLLFNCLMLDIVPDPANSKWAKECAKKKGELFVQVPLRDSDLSQEPASVEVQLPEDWGGGSSDPGTITSAPPGDNTSELPPQTAHHQTSYLKSFSQQSDASDQTQASQDTAVVYVSGLGNEEEEEEEEEEEAFFPSALSSFMGISMGGKLTLDAVRIDCSDFLE